MSEETKKAIEELEAIRLELFRSAASLDMAITQVKLFMGDPAGSESVKYAIKCILDYRMSQLRMCEWSTLNEKEDETWKKLVNSVKEEEEF